MVSGGPSDGACKQATRVERVASGCSTGLPRAEWRQARRELRGVRTSDDGGQPAQDAHSLHSPLLRVVPRRPAARSPWADRAGSQEPAACASPSPGGAGARGNERQLRSRFNAPAGHAVVAMISSPGNPPWPLDWPLTELPPPVCRPPPRCAGPRAAGGIEVAYLRTSFASRLDHHTPRAAEDRPGARPSPRRSSGRGRTSSRSECRPRTLGVPACTPRPTGPPPPGNNSLQSRNRVVI
jgi:hypothetical protein